MTCLAGSVGDQLHLGILRVEYLTGRMVGAHVTNRTRVPVMCNILVKSYNRQASVTFERLMGYQQNLRQSIGGQAPVPNPMSSQVSHL